MPVSLAACHSIAASLLAWSWAACCRACSARWFAARSLARRATASGSGLLGAWSLLGRVNPFDLARCNSVPMPTPPPALMLCQVERVDFRSKPSAVVLHSVNSSRPVSSGYSDLIAMPTRAHSSRARFAGICCRAARIRSGVMLVCIGG